MDKFARRTSAIATCTGQRRRGAPKAIVATVVLLLAACGGSVAATDSARTPEETTIAPSSTAARPAPDATATSALVMARGASLVGPTGLIFDAAGNLYISGCSWTASYIYRIDPSGVMTTFAGAGSTTFSGDGGPAKDATLQCPVGMAFGPDGALYFADHASNRVRRIDTTGIITTIAGSGPAGVDQGSFSGDGGPATKATLQEPWGIAFDHAGNLYIGDRDNYRVRRVDAHGVITTIAGTGVPEYSGDGGPAKKAGMCPQGVVVDPRGDLVVADPCNHRIRKVDARGVISTIAGTGLKGFAGDDGKATSALVDGPDFPVFDRSGGLLIQAGYRIRRIDPAGVITTVAGIGTFGAPHDGMPALQAPFEDLYGIAVDATGNVYVADGEATVYRIDTKGILTVFAGTIR